MIVTNDFNSEIQKWADTDIKYSDFYYAFCGRRKNYDLQYVIIFRETTDMETIAHEVIHFKNFVFIDRGIECDLKNDEAEAYFYGWAFKSVASFLMSLRKKND